MNEDNLNYKNSSDNELDFQYLEVFDSKVKVGSDLNDKQKLELKQLLEKFPKLLSFNDEMVGRIKNYEYKISLKPNAMPIHCSPSRVSFEQMQLIDNEIKALESKGIIRPSQSPWSSRTVLVKRKDGRVRLCIDFRSVNELIEGDAYPLADIQLCLRTIGNKRYISSLDANNAFHQLGLDKDSVEITGFVTPRGQLYEYTVIPFGLKISSAAFQRAIDMALIGLKYIDCASFVDDLAIAGETFEIHNQRLYKVLNRLNEFGFTLRANKCMFAMNKIVFLGYLISEDGLRPAPSLLEAIKNLKTPTNVTEIRSVIGLLSYTRKCIDHFSLNIEPISRLTKKNTPFIWGNEQQLAFEQIKQIYLNKPLIKFFDPNLDTELRTDASLKALAGVLVQKHGITFFPVGYFSRLTKETESKYAIYDLEIMAAIESMQYFNDLLIGHFFVLVTDNRAVSFIRNKKDLNGRLSRAALYMQEYDFSIEFRPSSKNKFADFLSRYPKDHELVDDKTVKLSEVMEFESKLNAVYLLSDNNLQLMHENGSHERSSPNTVHLYDSNPKPKDDNLTVSYLQMHENNNLKHIIIEQLKDSECKAIIDLLNNISDIKNTNIKKLLGSYLIKNGVLCKFVVRPDGVYYLICIPKSMRYEILYQYHDLNTSAHLGIKRTLNKIKDRFYWPNINLFVENYIKTCTLCQLRKKPKQKPAGLMMPIRVGNVFEQVAIDHLSSLPKSNGCEYIIVLTDTFSKFAICKPVAKSNAKTVAKFLFEDLICAYCRTPERILSDCNLAFLGKVVTHLNVLMGIKQVKTSGYRPNVNSITERYNHTIAECLSLFVNEKQTNWTKYVKPICFAYNATVQASSNYSPTEILFGRKAILPPDINLQINKIKGTPNEYALNLAKYLDEVKVKVLENLEKSHIKDKIRYDSKHRDVVYHKGDKVLFYNPAIVEGKQNKLLKRYSGPHVIIRQCSPLLYELDFKPTPLKPNIVNVSRLKPFYDREEMIFNFEQNHKPFISKFYSIRKSSKVHKTYKSDSNNSIDRSIRDNTVQPTLQLDNYINSSSGSSSCSDSEQMSNVSFSDRSMTDLSVSDVSEAEQNYNVEHGLRRSVRQRKPVNRLNLFAMTCVCLISLTGYVECLALTDPIIWVKLKNPVVRGVETITTVIDYESPCKIFSELMINEKSSNELRDWCESEFKSNFIEPLSQFCTNVGSKDSPKFGLMREKRFIFVGAIALFTIISVVASVGIGASSLSENLSVRNRISSIEEESLIAIKNIKELRQNAKIEKQIFDQFNRMLNNITNEVLEIRNDLHIIKETTPKAMRAISLITTKLHHTKNVLSEIGRDFKKGKLNYKFLDLFNYTVNCGENCPHEFWTPLNCNHDELRQMLIVRYTMKIINPKLHVMGADSFDLITKIHENGQTKLCHSVYNGPTGVLFDEVNHCIKPIKGKPSESTNLILVPKEAQCTSNEHTFSNSKYWTRGNCEDRESMDAHEIVQIKHARQYNYIYCASLNITIFNRLIPCPNEVFILPANTSFKIQDMEYEAQQLNLHTELHFVPMWSYAINHVIDPHMRSNLYDNYFSKLNMSINSLNTQSFNDKLENVNDHHKVANFILLSIIIFSCIAVVIWLQFKKCKKSSLKRNNKFLNIEQNNMETIDLEEIAGNDSIVTNNKSKPKSTESKVILTLK
jgi:hypothetical protein